LKDPFGHSWSLATHKRDLSKEEIEQAMAAMK
jgi:PhnB protein